MGTGNLSGRNNQTGETVIPLPELTEAVFLERKNRFAGLVEVAGRPYYAHVPSSGRMRELLFPGNPVYITPMPPGKRTQYRIHLARCGETLVSVDSLLPNRLMYKVLAGGVMEEFAGYEEIKKEVAYGQSRFDLYLRGNPGRCLIEIKSVTLVEDGTAKFPDAPSQRGAKHLLELAQAVKEDYRAAVIFVVQRDDARIFSPNLAADPHFTRCLHQAVSQGVEVYALYSEVTTNIVRLKGHLSIQLG
ncbi:sugar fermentation stimulation protein [Desulforamulus ruminis DSM 2154]|uniref:Sugar fermentation stimulation protein homolog n=1 Tax=Desulforamulus ruminis (strain ATCC 23193 / DSM 2154 / NCIMB 8452 / DL) TaxID=696281 RepID=F6DL90_DESRL|nr:sugar fermentation stimulation protein [Desulforamulus ruminis DSM 2154]